MLVQGSAEIVCDVIFSVGECACTAKAAHDGTRLAVDTALYFISVDGTFAFFKRFSGFENRNFKIRS